MKAILYFLTLRTILHLSMRNTEIRCKSTKKNVNTQITNVKILIFTKIFCF